MIRLEKVSERTFKTIINMKLPPEQNKFVAPNVVSLAQAWLYSDEALPLAILNDDEVVGFMMLDWDEGERNVGVWRFMISPEHQHKGYGRAALEAAIEKSKNAENIDMMNLDYVPGNESARKLYYSLGFRENGDVEDGEIVMTLPLTSTPHVGMLTADDEDADDFAELIDAETESGREIPEIFRDKEKLAEHIENGVVKRLTLMGETIGIAIGGVMLLSSEYESYSDEAKRLIK